jgi:hypothetical protein
LRQTAYNDYDPSVGDLQTVKFNKEIRTDEWIQTSLVIEGDLGFAQLVSATSYYDRELSMLMTRSRMQLTSTTLSVFITGMQPTTFGLDPTGYLTNKTEADSFTQEIRLAGSTDRIDWTLGGFWQESEEFWDFYTYVDDYRNSPAFETLERLLSRPSSH